MGRGMGVGVDCWLGVGGGVMRRGGEVGLWDGGGGWRGGWGWGWVWGWDSGRMGNEMMGRGGK